jgi:hypothetical protein
VWLCVPIALQACVRNGPDHSGGTPALETSDRIYIVEDRGGKVTLEIPFELRNDTGDTIWPATCGSDASVYVQEQGPTGWGTAFAHVCGEPGAIAPVSLVPGARIADTLPIWISHDLTITPRLDRQAIPGTFLLAINMSSGDPEQTTAPTGRSVLISNEFRIVVASDECCD